MDERKRYEDALSKGALLKIYIQALKQNIKILTQASLFHRNPYFRSRLAKQHMQAVLDAIQHCQDTIFLYMASLAKLQLCSKCEIHAYFFVYQFLFNFQDDIKKQECMHMLFIRNSLLLEEFDTFMIYTKEFISMQEAKIKELSKEAHI